MMKCPNQSKSAKTAKTTTASSSQSSMFFSSGQAQMKGGGDFCMLRYSYDGINREFDDSTFM